VTGTETRPRSTGWICRESAGTNAGNIPFPGRCWPVSRRSGRCVLCAANESRGEKHRYFRPAGPVTFSVEAARWGELVDAEQSVYRRMGRAGTSVDDVLVRWGLWAEFVSECRHLLGREVEEEIILRRLCNLRNRSRLPRADELAAAAVVPG